MKYLSIFLCLVLLAVSSGARQASTVIRAGTLLDGKGGVLHNVVVVVQDTKITRV